MPVASSTAAPFLEYRFGRFRLNPATRELWTEGTLHPASPLVFDCLVYLLNQRQRMVGRDELVSAVWGRVDVADQQVRQLIQRTRQAVGDDAKNQRAIRTVPGGGYRWVMPVEIADAPDDPPPQAESDLDASTLPPSHHKDAPDPTDAAAASRAAAAQAPGDTPVKPIRVRARLRAIAILGGVLLLLAIAAIFYDHLRTKQVLPARTPTVPGTGHAVVVLPLKVTGPSDTTWIRLGAMDLVAQRLRSIGMPVPPSDSIVSAVHVVGEPDTPERLAMLRETLGAATLVQGTAVKSADGWTLSLQAVSADGQRRTAQAERADATEAARDAADLLLAALGEVAPRDTHERDDLSWLLQRARAALLADQLDAARTILAGAPEEQHGDPRLRVVAARIDQRAGRPAEAEATLRALLDEPVSNADSETRADALTALGYLELNRNDCAAAERHFDAALLALQDRRGSRYGNVLSVRGSARACLGRPEEAVQDLSAAGPLLDAAGDRLGRANLDNHFGAIELYRGRPAQAAAYLQAARATHQSFGAVDNTRRDLSLLCIALGELLRWPEALEASDALWALREQVDDAAALYAAAGLRARILVRTGKHREAKTLLDRVEAAHPTERASPYAATFHEARAELAWANGDARQVVAAIDEAWKVLPPQKMRDDEDLFTILLRQRAMLALGQAPDEAGASWQPERAGDAMPIPLLVARAERESRLQHIDEAETVFREAMKAAETRDVPAMTVLATDAYARWLLARGRTDDARATAGRITPWTERDFDSAALQVAVFHAAAQTDAWREALSRANALAGERTLPIVLAQPPAP
jgi:DNA-binding winged helix-turn-helix (wHTH) protein/tetratricopeptide (TPR) repeat protein